MLSAMFKVCGTGFDVLFFLASSIEDILVHIIVFDWGKKSFSNDCFVWKIFGGSSYDLFYTMTEAVLGTDVLLMLTVGSVEWVMSLSCINCDCVFINVWS